MLARGSPGRKRPTPPGRRIKKAAALVVCEEEGRTRPRAGRHQLRDDIRVLLLSPLDIGGRVLADLVLRDEERDLRQRAVVQVSMVVVFAELQALIVLPFGEHRQAIEVFERYGAAEAQTQVVALPGDLVRVEKVGDG